MGEVEVLMERMKQLQECRDEEEASQEEMATRFEREKTESMLVATTGMFRERMGVSVWIVQDVRVIIYLLHCSH